ncbi:MAG: signal peptidase I [Ignavibacteriaceae bacterium]|nr:signal peptidase I [Ignavibacteriaceae bacterium]
MGNFTSKLGKLIKIIFWVILIAVLIKAFAIDAFRIPSSSMENTLMPGDFIIANKFAYNITTPKEIPFTNISIPYAKLFEIGKPEINDVVIFQFPEGYETDPKKADRSMLKG